MPTSSSTSNRLIPGAARRGPGDERVLLLPSADGWSLVTAGGRVLVRGIGQRSRRQCLEYASATGVLTVLS